MDFLVLFFNLYIPPALLLVLIFCHRSWFDRMRYRIKWEFWFILFLGIFIAASMGIVLASHHFVGHIPADAGEICAAPALCAWKAIGALLELDGGTLVDYADQLGFPGSTVFAGALTFLIPLTTAGTAIVFILGRVPHPMLYSREYVIFSRLDQNSLRMAMDLNRWNLRFIFLRTEQENAPSDLMQQLRGFPYQLYPLVEADLLQRHWGLRRKKLHFYFLSENTDENFDQASQFLDAFQASDHHRGIPLFQTPWGCSGKEVRQELYILSETSTAPMLIDDLRAKLCRSDKSKRLSVFAHTDIHLLDRYRAISYDLLRRVPLYDSAIDRQNHVLVLGFGQMGREFFRAAASFCVMHGFRTRFTLLDSRFPDLWDTFRRQYPALMQDLVLRTEQMDVESEALMKLIRSYHNTAPITYIVVALGDDERSIRVALQLKRYYRKLHWEGKLRVPPTICVHIEDELKSANAAQLFRKMSTVGQAHVFGGLHQTFVEELLTPRNLWCAARMLQEGFLRGKSFPAAWNEYERRSTLAAVSHAKYHLHAGGTPDEQQSAEHLRWMRYVCSEGMQLASTAMVERYAKKLKKHVDVAGLLTPCLVSTEKLKSLDAELRRIMDWPEDRPSLLDGDRYVVSNAQILEEIIRTGDTQMTLRPYEKGISEGLS